MLFFLMSLCFSSGFLIGAESLGDSFPKLFYGFDPQLSAPDEKGLSFLSYNIGGFSFPLVKETYDHEMRGSKERKPILKETLEDFLPQYDLSFFQETHNYPLSKEVPGSFFPKKGFLGVQFQNDRLERFEIEKHYQLIDYASSNRRVFKNNAWHSVRYPLISLLEVVYKRKALVTELTKKDQSESLVLTNIHFSPSPKARFVLSADLRLAQLEWTLEKFKEKYPDAQIVLFGDFNTTDYVLPKNNQDQDMYRLYENEGLQHFKNCLNVLNRFGAETNREIFVSYPKEQTPVLIDYGQKKDPNDPEPYQKLSYAFYLGKPSVKLSVLPFSDVVYHQSVEGSDHVPVSFQLHSDLF